MKNLKSIATGLLAVAFAILGGFTGNIDIPPEAMSWNIDQSHNAGSWSETAVIGDNEDISIALELQHDLSGCNNR